MTEISYKDFIKYVHRHFEDETSLEEVEKVLYLKEGYNKDNPSSIGKSLVLNRLVFSGKKISGEKYRYDQKLYKGINTWIADNHKGKSTIFKIIKFALTGTNSIKRDIKPWIEKILLEFNIGKVTYTCYIDRTGRDRGALYRLTITEFIELDNNKKLDTIDSDIEFAFKSNIQMEEKLQEFFFEQFSFYTLKYTQHSSSKDDFNLKIANLSWSTYFKSIYLESSNYEYLFFDGEKYGSQGRKIFEMILGLPLTYPINMLNLQLDRVKEEIGKIKLTDKSKAETTKAKKEKVNKRLLEAQKELAEIKKSGQITFDENPLIEEYNRIQETVNEIRKRKRLANEAYQTEINKKLPLETEIRNLKNDHHKIETEINKLSKQELNIELYKQTESFFSNLDIKTCPHCEIDISENKKKNEQEKHVCSLCGEISTQQKVEETELLEKLYRIKEEKKKHLFKLQKITKVIDHRENELKTLKKSISDNYFKLVAVPSIDSYNRELKEIEAQIKRIYKERNEQKELIQKKNELIKEEAVLKFQLKEINNEKKSDRPVKLKELDLKKEILNYALHALEHKRIKLNKDILNKLKQLILNEIQSFGLTNIEQINIDDKYNLIFTQNQVDIFFNDLTEGEKLRAKLAFYLSLIQLDIEHNLGRHPRFLIFDSPGSEEMVPKHLHGLSDILKNVNDRFKDQLQIFVGSALREFVQISDKKKTMIKKEDQFVF
ncbi:hypothetical protein DMA11_21870 [Marinilabiliaceae bacterium JC017]|nr:hypothetical protein DMA11_21870 [Marinilabiliaceae bacterium JC017]